VVDEVALERVSFPSLIIIPPFLHEVCDSPDQAAHYHTLGPKFGASFLTGHLAGLGVKVVLVKIFKLLLIAIYTFTSPTSFPLFS
jgi:hypothetical protein